MYVISGKGSVAGADLAHYIVDKCRAKGILWDDDLPEYTLDFLTNLPSVSMSIREGNSSQLAKAISQRLNQVEMHHTEYMLLCLTAHKLEPLIKTNLKFVNLWGLARSALGTFKGNTAFLGTKEAAPADSSFTLLPNHSEKLGDLITSVKRGYHLLGESYAAHPKNLLKRILEEFESLNVSNFFIACTDLHVCKKYMIELGIDTNRMVDIVELAGDEIIKRKGRPYDTEFLDAVSDYKTTLRYKYLAKSDSLLNQEKYNHFIELVDQLPSYADRKLEILDIGGSSTGNAEYLSNKKTEKSHIIIQDISQESLLAAKQKNDSVNHSHIEFDYLCGSIVDLSLESKQDIVLCLGVLLYQSSDAKFKAVIKQIYSLLEDGGFLIVRDAVYSGEEKLYLDFGGVVRNESAYDAAFLETGFVFVAERRLVTDFPFTRTIKTIVWKKC